MSRSRRLSGAGVLLLLAVLCAAARALCTLAGLRPMTAVISGSLPAATADPALAALLGALYAACELASLLFAPAFVLAALMLTAWNTLAHQRNPIKTNHAAARTSRSSSVVL